MEKLKACPFCGGKAEFERFNSPKNWFVVRCTVCGCQTDGFRINHDDATDAQNKSANAAVWNRRTETENKPLTLGQLRQMDDYPQPIWIELLNIAKPISCELITSISEDGIHTMAESGRDYAAFSLYGKTWLAYARKPEGSET